MATRREFPQIRARGGVQYLSGGVRREYAGMRPSRKNPAAPWEPRVLSPHRLLGAAIFLPRPTVGRVTRPVRHFRRARGGSGELRLGLGRLQNRGERPGQRGRDLRCFRGGARYPGVTEASEERLRATASPRLLPRGRHPWRDPRGLVLGWAGRGLLAGRLQLPPGPSGLPAGNGSGDGASTFPRRQLQRYHSRR